VKLGIVPVLASWVVKFADTFNSELISFISTGIKEKEVKSEGHLRCLRVIFKNSNILARVSFPPLCFF
jgi:hypothetical protein